MVIRGRQISYRYPGESDPIFSSLDFEIRGPGFISLFGLSGTGKSTLAKLISRELTPDKGTITINGPHTVLYAWNTERLPGWCNVGEHIRQVTPEGRESLSEHLINELELAHLLENRFRELSMGQKNRINLLRYLLQDFDMLIGDEVLANVDEPSRNRILGVIKREFPHQTFLYISHNAAEVVRFSKEIIVLPVAAPHRHVTVMEGLDNSSVSPSKLQAAVLSLLQNAAGDPVAFGGFIPDEHGG